MESRIVHHRCRCVGDASVIRIFHLFSFCFLFYLSFFILYSIPFLFSFLFSFFFSPLFNILAFFCLFTSPLTD